MFYTYSLNCNTTLKNIRTVQTCLILSSYSLNLFTKYNSESPRSIFGVSHSTYFHNSSSIFRNSILSLSTKITSLQAIAPARRNNEIIRNILNCVCTITVPKKNWISQNRQQSYRLYYQNALFTLFFFSFMNIVVGD